MTEVALAHDVLAARAGGERVLLALARAFPAAPIHTLMHEPDATFAAFAGHQIDTTWLQRIGWLRRHYRPAIPVAALTYKARQIDAGVTVCSTSGLSHHVRTTGAKVVYCHTPARWLHDSSRYLYQFPQVAQRAARAAAPAFRKLDRRAMHSADRVVANSAQTAREIADIYDIDAIVINPCSTLDIAGPAEPLPGVTPGFVLSPARPLGYKRLDVLLDAARRVPDRQFVHIGDGPHRQVIMRDIPPNVLSFSQVNDAQLRWAYRNAQVVGLTCAEDFGLVPLEAAAHGVHTVAPHARGLLDHRTDMLTTYRFGSDADLVEALSSAPEPTGAEDPTRLGQDRFIADMQSTVAEFQ